MKLLIATIITIIMMMMMMMMMMIIFNYGNHGTVLIIRQVFRQMEQVTCCLMFFKGDSITIDKHETTLSNKINN